MTISLVGVLTVPWALPTVAQTEWPPPVGAACKPTQAQLEEAKLLVSLLKRAAPRDAIFYVQRAYMRDCHNHRLLLELAKAQEAEGQPQRAIESYRLFLDRGKTTVQEKLDLEKTIARLATLAPASSALGPGDEPWEPPRYRVSTAPVSPSLFAIADPWERERPQPRTAASVVSSSVSRSGTVDPWSRTPSPSTSTASKAQARRKAQP